MQAIALFNKPQRKERSDRTVEIFQAIAFLTNRRGAENTEEKESDHIGKF